MNNRSTMHHVASTTTATPQRLVSGSNVELVLGTLWISHVTLDNSPSIVPTSAKTAKAVIQLRHRSGPPTVQLFSRTTSYCQAQLIRVFRSLLTTPERLFRRPLIAGPTRKWCWVIGVTETPAATFLAQSTVVNKTAIASNQLLTECFIYENRKTIENLRFETSVLYVSIFASVYWTCVYLLGPIWSLLLKRVQNSE